MTPDQRLSLLKLQDTLESSLEAIASILRQENDGPAPSVGFNILDWQNEHLGVKIRRDDHQPFIKLVEKFSLEWINDIVNDLGKDASFESIKYVLSKDVSERKSAIMEVVYLAMLKRWGIVANVDTARQWYEVLKTASKSKSPEDHGKALQWMVTQARKGGVPLSFPNQANPFVKAYRETLP
jgi:hypothetical protein